MSILVVTKAVECAQGLTPKASTRALYYHGGANLLKKKSLDVTKLRAAGLSQWEIQSSPAVANYPAGGALKA
jgi:hypothetical protein